MKVKIKKIISITIILIGAASFALSLYIKNVFGDAQIEQLIYSLLLAEGTSKSVILNGLSYCIPIVLFILICFSIPIIVKNKKEIYIKLLFKLRTIKIKIFPLPQILYSIVIFLALTIYSLNSVGMIEYIKKQTENSKIFEDYYIDPNTINIEFPKEKQNLIHIYLESMETSYNAVVIDNKQVNLIPNLEKLSQEYTSFSNTKSFGGAAQLPGTTWTIAAIVAQTAGIPLKIPIQGNKYDHYDNFLPGVTTLGDILEKEGYSQYFLIGSNGAFGGRELYLKSHGNYNIYDYNWAIENNKIDSDYLEFWGYEDKKLFEFAKEELTKISKQKEPFNFTILTVDTHAVDGYLDKSCKNEYDYQYANVISCSDKMVSQFVEWVMKQDFYKNTTIIITGDHSTMQGDIVNYLNTQNRTIYNTFINSKVTTNNTENRLFSSFDIFPTTLASLGVKIKGERLGLGTNLFSNKNSLLEELGLEYMHQELTKNSKYYNLKFLKNTYYDMIQEINDEKTK